MRNLNSTFRRRSYAKFVVILLACAIVVVIGLLRQSVKTKSIEPQFSQNDFAKYGVVLITPSSPQFGSSAAALLEGQEAELKELVNSARPFSVFVQNLNDSSIVGCSLAWHIEKSDGTVVNTGQSYSTPGVLMGMQPVDKNMIGHTHLINPQARAFLSLDSETKQLIDWRTKSLVQLRPLDANNKKAINDLSRDLNQLYGDLVKSSRKITVSLDAVIFSDGSYMGPDRNHLITFTESMVDAKRDLARSIEADLQSGKERSSIWKRLESMAKSPTVGLGATKKSLNEQYRQSYEEHIGSYIQELLRIRAASGEDAAIMYSQAPLQKSWPKLRPR